jgi:hypothetical protein
MRLSNRISCNLDLLEPLAGAAGWPRRPYNKESPQVGWTVVARKVVGTPRRTRRGTVQRKVRAPQDAVMANNHRPKFLPLRDEANEGPGKCNRKIPPSR